MAEKHEKNVLSTFRPSLVVAESILEMKFCTCRR